MSYSTTPINTPIAARIYVVTGGALTTSLVLTSTGDPTWGYTPGWRARVDDLVERDARVFVIKYERNARGGMRVARPPQSAPIDPWIPTARGPRARMAAWPARLRRFRGDA